jgi:signal peptidase I
MNEKTTNILGGMQDELFEKEGKGWFRIVSGSMSPIIEINDRVFVKKIALNQIKIKDIVIFDFENVFVAHRVINILKLNGERMILQKGDASLYSSLISPEVVVGKVIVIEKKGKLLYLESLRGKFVSRFIESRNSLAHKFNRTIRKCKLILEDKPGFEFFRTSYRFIKRPVVFFNRKIIRCVYTVFFEK